MNLTTHAISRLLHEAEIPGAAHRAGDDWVRVHLREESDERRALAVLTASGYLATASDLLPGTVNVTGLRVGPQDPATLRIGDEIRWQRVPHATRWRLQLAQVEKLADGFIHVEGLGWQEANPGVVDYLTVMFRPESTADVTRRAEMPFRP